jgi:exoribonuclease II
MTDDEQQRELEERVMRYRMLEREVTDPLAARLLQDIVAELEADLRESGE